MSHVEQTASGDDTDSHVVLLLNEVKRPRSPTHTASRVAAVLVGDVTRAQADAFWAASKRLESDRSARTGQTTSGNLSLAVITRLMDMDAAQLATFAAGNRQRWYIDGLDIVQADYLDAVADFVAPYLGTDVELAPFDVGAGALPVIKSGAPSSAAEAVAAI